MLDFAAAQPVGEIVARFPAASRVFARHSIDFCCGGRKPLEAACSERGLAADVLLGELREEATRSSGEEVRDWTEAPLAQLVGHILVRYHAPLRAELPRLDALAGRAHAAHGDGTLAPFSAIAAQLGALRAELEDHMQKEEIVLFPAVKRLERTALDGSAAIDPLCGSIAYPIRAMVHEHVEAAGHLAELRRLTDGYRIPDGACGTVISLIAGLEELESELHRHIHLENEILFPRAEKLAQSQRHPEEATL